MSDLVLPAHVGIIMDGNRRWAKQHSLPTLEGHRQGAEAFRRAVKAGHEMGLQYMSAYVFSSENWSRTQEEVSYLMGLVVQITKKYLKEFHNLGVRIIVLGSRDGLDKKVLAAVEHTEELTKDNGGMVLGLCFNYGGRQEIVQAARAAIASGEELTVESISTHVYHPEIPGVDLMIRTSGEERTSGYMLWRSDYAELLFLEKFWPEFTPADLEAACAEYARRQRRFGS